jgi:hypothetical protein
VRLLLKSRLKDCRGVEDWEDVKSLCRLDKEDQ